ncbi:MAG TPA: type ISP restriction/modification enzyme [Sphingomicrobium sp.]|nr:type ISP restriction/modification enzyme [Sphingomicrobium sp.]
MSHVLIQRYLDELSDLRRLSGTERETVVREAFKSLLKGWGRSHELKFIPEYPLTTANNDKRYIDGALVDPVRIPFGYWEAKDSKDNLDKEIERKFRRGYPQDNIIFEDSREAVLIQDTKVVMRCEVSIVPSLRDLLNQFFSYESPARARFRRAIEQFKIDLPDVLDTLRRIVDAAGNNNASFQKSAGRFLKHARATVHPTVTAADINEMLIQHILTEEIFSKVFDQDEFHRKNNIAKLLYELEATFFTGDVKWQTLNKLAAYYSAINSAALEVRGHHEKQTFLKVVYQNFYHVYNAKLADRLGVVYTPNEIVRFIVESAEWLCQHNFKKRLIDRNVEILEPAAGTGTFVTELIDYFRREPERLREKYLEEIHANEIAILPYYVANLNIEASYASLMREYVEFPNLCFVDTLDSVEGLGKFSGHQEELFGALSEENYARIKRQNERKISVVLGNPPYNANQIRENDNNQNRKYPKIDSRIRSTYLARSTAQKTKLYDPYVRFFRWAADRIHDAGVVAFITNRSYIDAKNFDGFRRTVVEEFDDIFIVDLGGDWKKKGSAGGGNVFGIGTGVAIGFWIRRPGAEKKNGRIFYASAPEGSGEEKLAWLNSLNEDGRSFEDISFSKVEPKSGYWIDNPEDFDSEIPIASKDVRSANNKKDENAIFKLYSLGISTNRDDWLYDVEEKSLLQKIRFLKNVYDEQTSNKNYSDDIKWSETLKKRRLAKQKESVSQRRVRNVLYRPYSERLLYDSELYIDRPGAIDRMFPRSASNPTILVSAGQRGEFSVCASDKPVSLDFFVPNAACLLPRMRFLDDGIPIDNITDRTMERFLKNYSKVRSKITKDAIFDYTYAVLHNPSYRKKYALNLRRELPRLPLYSDFILWSRWGRKLLDLHIGYQTVEPWRLKRADLDDRASRTAGLEPAVSLRGDHNAGVIRIDSETVLSGIPAEAWDYKIGSRSALAWVLDQHGERLPRDATVRERFHTYKFSNQKERVIDLLGRITRVSIETQKIVGEMMKVED